MADRAAQRILPVLTYHSIDDSGSTISTSPATFRRQMQVLAEAGWRTLTVEEMLAGRTSGQWPLRSFVLTFDDGYRNVFDVAAPLLEKHRFHAIVFVVADRVGLTAQWRDQPEAVAGAPLMDWRELQALLAIGMSLGAHSLTHTRLPAISADDAEREIVGSKRTIEDRCGVAVTTFAYPYGARTDAIEQLAAQHYRLAFGTRLGFATPQCPVMNLKRLDAYYLRRFSLIERLDSPLAGIYVRARAGARAVRAGLSRGR
jgi:peptidoglycan/xylan/chitin deacetylase (PgdA/CDA1 family)